MIDEIYKGVYKLRYGEPETFTPVSMRARAPRADALEGMEAAALPFGEDKIVFNRTKRGVTIELPMQVGEDIFGFGLQLLSANCAGRKRLVKVNSDTVMNTGESHAPVPFYVSSAGYGLFADTYRYATFYMGTHSKRGASRDVKAVNLKHNLFSESALYALKKAKQQRCIIIDIPAARGVELYIFAGDIRDAARRYILFSGGGCLPPMWGLGVWYRMYGGCDQQALIEMAQRFRAERMPISVLGAEPGWHSHAYSCTYEWSSLFPNPREMIDKIRAMGYQLNLWEHAFVYPASPIYESLLPFSGDYEVWNGLVPDLASDSTRAIFADWHCEQFVLKGVTGFKLDECDNSDYNASNWSFPDTTLFPSGMDGEQMHNAFGVLYQQMMDDMFRKRGVRTYSQARSSGALAAPLPFVLYSDLYKHNHFIRGMTTAPFSGLLWAPEVRACASGNDLLRRVETAVFSVHALLNCWRITSPPWCQVNTELNLSGERMENADYFADACRKLFELRMSLLPYLYSAFVEYNRAGIPPVRHMSMDAPNDDNAMLIDTQFFFGKDLLVCPLTVEDGTERMVYLPGGAWYNFFSGERYEGNREIAVRADWHEIPVFVRDGALVPFAKPVEYVARDTVFDITIRAYGNKPGSYTLYEDDFTTTDYEQTGISAIQITRDAHGELRVSGIDGSNKYRIMGIERIC